MEEAVLEGGVQGTSPLWSHSSTVGEAYRAIQASTLIDYLSMDGDVLMCGSIPTCTLKCCCTGRAVPHGSQVRTVIPSVAPQESGSPLATSCVPVLICSLSPAVLPLKTVWSTPCSIAGTEVLSNTPDLEPPLPLPGVYEFYI